MPSKNAKKPPSIGMAIKIRWLKKLGKFTNTHTYFIVCGIPFFLLKMTDLKCWKLGKTARKFAVYMFLNNSNSMMKQYIFNYILECRGFSWCIHSNRWFDSKPFSLHKMTNCEITKNEVWRQKLTIFIHIWCTQNAKNINFHLQNMCGIHKSP